MNRKVGKKTKHLGHASSLDGAVKILQKAYPEEAFTKANLAISARPCVRVPLRKYAKVYYEAKRAGRCKWLQHESYGGRAYWETEDECAEVVVAYLGVPVCVLLLPKASLVRHPCRLQQSIFAALYDNS